MSHGVSLVGVVQYNCLSTDRTLARTVLKVGDRMSDRPAPWPAPCGGARPRRRATPRPSCTPAPHREGTLSLTARAQRAPLY